MQPFLSLGKCQSLRLCKGYLHAKRCVILAVIVCGVAPFHIALALSCGREAALQKYYDSSIYIVVAKLAVCTKAKDASNRYCQEWELEIDEILKGDSPPKKLRAIQEYSVGYPSPRTGEIRLLFSSSEKAFIAGGVCAPNDVLNRERSERVQEKIDRLRKYRDGIVADLSEPWRFGKSGSNCAIVHRFERGFISLNYNLSRNGIERNTPGLVITTEGVRFEPQSPRLSVVIERYRDIWTARDISIKIGQQLWSLESPSPGWSLLSPDNMRAFAGGKMNHIIQGAVVMDILNAMTPPAAITIRANHSPVGSRVISNELADVDYEAKTTHINQAAQQFRECMALGAASPAKATNKTILDLL